MTTRTRARNAILALAACAATALLAAGCGGGDDPEAAASPGQESEAAAPEGTFVGRVEGSNAYLALVSDGERMSGYLCDGEEVSVWLDEVAISRSEAGLASRDGDALGTATIAGRDAHGEVELGGEAHRFTAQPAPLGGEAGLYREASADFPAPGARVTGWIVLADGSLRGRTNVMDPNLDFGRPAAGKPAPGTRVMDPGMDF